MGNIVVGIDGSEQSMEALEWAIAEAKLRDSVLIIGYCWQLPIMYGPEMVYVPPPDISDMQSNARDAAEHIVQGSTLAASGVPHTIELPSGRPGVELVRLAEGAELLVVGSRGHGSMKEFLLGSTSAHCVHHAACPVVVVRSAAT